MCGLVGFPPAFSHGGRKRGGKGFLRLKTGFGGTAGAFRGARFGPTREVYGKPNILQPEKFLFLDG